MSAISDPEYRRQQNAETRIVILGSMLFVGSTAIFYMFPAFLQALADRLSLDAADMGLLAGAESAAIALTSLLGPFWINRFSQHSCMIVGVVLCIAGNVLTILASSFWLVLLSRMVAGLLGEGVLGPISFALLGATKNSDRAFAIAITAAVTVGAAMIAISAPLTHIFPRMGTIAPLLAVTVSVVPFIRWADRRDLAPRNLEPAGSRSPRIPLAATSALLAQFLWAAGPGAFWVFSEHVATDAGIPRESAEIALAVGEFVSLLGSVAAAWQIRGWGRLRSISFGTLGMIVSAIIFAHCTSAVGVALALSAFYSFWNYSIVYQMGFISDLDGTGRLSSMIPAGQVMGLSCGPFCTGLLIPAMGNRAVTLATVAFVVAGMALYGGSVVSGHRALVRQA